MIRGNSQSVILFLFLLLEQKCFSAVVKQSCGSLMLKCNQNVYVQFACLNQHSVQGFMCCTLYNTHCTCERYMGHARGIK